MSLYARDAIPHRSLVETAEAATPLDLPWTRLIGIAVDTPPAPANS